MNWWLVCKIHRYHPNFQVYCASCLRSFSKWNTFKKHLSRGCNLQIHESDTSAHPERTHDLDLTTLLDDSSTLEGMVDNNSLDIPSQEWHEAAYILYIKKNHVITQAAIDTILPHTNQLFLSFPERVSSELKTKLSMEFVEQAHSHVLPMFSNLSTCYLQRKFFREQFSLLVSLHTKNPT